MLTCVALCTATTAGQPSDENPNQVLDWNQVFIDTLIATNTPNSSSQRLGAIVHAAVFDAYNGIERRYTPIFVHDLAPRGASRRAAVIAAAHKVLVKLFPTRETQLDRAVRGFNRGPQRRWWGRGPVARAGHRVGHSRS